MARMFKCDRCRTVGEGFSHILEMPQGSWWPLAIRDTKEICNSCQKEFNALIMDFMNEKI